MNPGEHEVMARVADRHWWYRGLRDVVGRCLATRRCALPPRPRILDAGCGTGENLRFLIDRLAPSHAAGFDFSEEALALARRKVPDATLHRADICTPEIPDHDSYDLVTSFDVLCIPGLARALPGVRRLVAALRPGGLFLLNLPAYHWLRSEHDVAVHTTQRFTTRDVRRLWRELGLEPCVLSYRLFFLFPAIALSRLWHKPPASLTADAARSDLHRPPGATLDRVLFAAVRAENPLIARGGFLPCGGSVFAIGRKPATS